jgi:hypothetical protein
MRSVRPTAGGPPARDHTGSIPGKNIKWYIYDTSYGRQTNFENYAFRTAVMESEQKPRVAKISSHPQCVKLPGIDVLIKTVTLSSVRQC